MLRIAWFVLVAGLAAPAFTSLSAYQRGKDEKKTEPVREKQVEPKNSPPKDSSNEDRIERRKEREREIDRKLNKQKK